MNLLASAHIHIYILETKERERENNEQHGRPLEKVRKFMFAPGMK
jgi:hypothetical protein